MKLISKNPSAKNVISCPQCEWPLLVEPAQDLRIIPFREMSPLIDGTKYLGRVKCPRCRNQITLHYN